MSKTRKTGYRLGKQATLLHPMFLQTLLDFRGLHRCTQTSIGKGT